MSLYHGTSASAALHILEQGTSPSRDGFLYCFSSDKPESMAGALCFATGGNLRAGSIDTRDVLSQYYKLNPDFPKGLKGVFLKTAMNAAIASWSKDQKKLSAPPYPDQAAIIVFKSHSDAIHVEGRGGFVNEVKVPAAALPSLQVETAYFDDALMASAEVERLRQAGIKIEPLSIWAKAVQQQTQPKNTFKGKPPTR